MPAVLEPPSTESALRDYAEELSHDFEERLDPELTPEESEPNERATVRQKFFDEMRTAIRTIANSPAWRAHDLARDLLLLLEDWRDEMEADPEAIDPEWRQKEVLQRLRVVLQTMIRQMDHDKIDRPEHAATLVTNLMEDVEDSEVAGLLETTPKMVARYRSGEVGQIRKNPTRITLIGQLVYELQYSMTPRGMLLWFDAPMDALAGRTPRELIDDDPGANRTALMSLARGGRAQLDLGGVIHGDVDDGP